MTELAPNSPEPPSAAGAPLEVPGDPDDSAAVQAFAAAVAARTDAGLRAVFAAAPVALPLLHAFTDRAERWTDALMDQSPDRARRACRAGCSSCCYLQVAITIPEALWIAERLRATRSAAAFAETQARIADHARRVADLTIEGRAAARVPCALLGADGACTIYEFRPIGCRGYTSFSKEACDAALAANEPGHDGPLDRVGWAAAGAVTEGLTRGLREAARDPGHYELHNAIDRCLADPDAGARWLRGEDAFSDCPRVVSERLRGRPV